MEVNEIKQRKKKKAKLKEEEVGRRGDGGGEINFAEKWS